MRFDRLVLEVRGRLVGLWRLHRGGLVQGGGDAWERLKPLEAVLHSPGSADDGLRGLEVGEGVWAASFGLLFSHRVNDGLLILLAVEPHVILLVLRVGPRHSALQLVGITPARRAIDVTVEQRVARFLPLLRPHLRVALPIVILEELSLLRTAEVLRDGSRRLLLAVLHHVVLRQLGDLASSASVFLLASGPGRLGHVGRAVRLAYTMLQGGGATLIAIFLALAGSAHPPAHLPVVTEQQVAVRCTREQDRLFGIVEAIW